MRRTIIATLALLSTGLATAEPQVTVGIVTDGPQARALVPIELFEREVLALTENEFEISIPEEKVLDGAWSVDGITDALRRQLRDPEVDVILLTGGVGSHVAARLEPLPKPVIAAVVADTELQNFPLENGASGKTNFVYVSNFRGVDFDLRTFRSVVDFKHLAVFVDQAFADGVPSLVTEKPRAIEEQLGVTVDIVMVTDNVGDAMSRLPARVDAVYVAPLPRFDDGKMRQLAAGLVERGLPSFSLMGIQELDYGLLLAASGRPGDQVRFARRLALDLQRILLGEDPSTFQVDFKESQRLAINMRTARSIGFSPRYAVLADAEQLFDEEIDGGEPLGLAEAMVIALESNINLKAASLSPQLAIQDISAARSNLLPQLGVGLARTQIDADRANPLIQSEKSSSLNLEASQVVYSDDLWANLRITEYLAVAEQQVFAGLVLDLLSETASRYLSVLRAKALEAVQRANLEVTRTNLQLAGVRESIGFTGRAEVLRWESQIATDRQNLIGAEADRRAAVTALNQTLNRPQNQNFSTQEEELRRSIAIFEDERFQAFIDNAAVWETFQDFQVLEAQNRSPELKQLEALRAAREREVVSARRRYFVPEVSLSGSGGSVINRSGVGSQLTGTGLDDESWTVSLGASWPLFTSGALKSRLNKARFASKQVSLQYEVVKEQIESRVRVALHRASGSYPALELSADAARAARENLDLVTDAYTEGAVSVTDLIDAQNAALTAELRSAEARYAYLLDLVEILRASGDFSLLLDPSAAEGWFQRVEAFFAERGVSPRR